MVVYACNCLNVKIFADAIKLQDVNLSNPLGRNAVEIELGDRGFDFKQGFLLKKETVELWTIFTCLNCKKKTHCINREFKLILVNKDMESGDDVLAQMAASPDFSPVFQIILTDRDLLTFPDHSTESYNKLQQHLSKISDQLESFLFREEDVVEARIRRFEEEQRDYLAQLKAKAQDDKRKLISVLLQQTEPREQRKPAKVIGYQNGLINSTGLFGTSPIPPILLSPPELHYKGRVMPDVDRDELFFFEDSDEGGSPQNNSSEEEEDIPVGSVRQKRANSKVRKPLYSASLPVNIERSDGKTGSDSDSMVEDDDEGKPLDLSMIASSMQALAQSVRDEGRYIFGDRPRPRFNMSYF